MVRDYACSTILAVFVATSGAACSQGSPVAPDASFASHSNRQETSATLEAPGTYEIFFLKSSIRGLEPVLDFTLNVGDFLALSSEIRDSNGVRVFVGTVTYEYCEKHNVKVPRSECDSGAGRWTRLLSMPVDPIGSRAAFGTCSTPRTIGFRVRYSGKGGSVASGVSAPKDVSWQ
jgi:hypothetical protein